MCGMIENNHPAQEGAHMLRKKKSLLDRAADSASDAVDAARPVIESAIIQVRDLSKDAADQAKVLAKDTSTKAGPLLADTKVLASEIAEATREVAIPKAKTAAAAGVAGAASLAASGKDLASAKVAEVKGEPQQKKGSKVRKLLIFGALAAAAGFAYNKLRGSGQADNWQSSYTPPASAGTSSTTSSTTGSTTSATSAAGGAHLAPGVGSDEPIAGDDPMARLAAEQGATGDDPGGASPDEALADAVEEPHAVTTPDDPADVVEVEEQAKKK
jgi:hypothetical protein